MGCDIHLFVEIKMKDKWEFYRQIHMPRYYDLFAKMADVRNEKKYIPISYPKGIPAALSEITMIHYKRWKSDMHHKSWFNQLEIKQTIDFLQKNHEGDKFILKDIIGFLFGNEYQHLHKYKDDFPEEIQDVRWIFWFDN